MIKICTSDILYTFGCLLRSSYIHEQYLWTKLKSYEIFLVYMSTVYTDTEYKGHAKILYLIIFLRKVCVCVLMLYKYTERMSLVCGRITGVYKNSRKYFWNFTWVRLTFYVFQNCQTMGEMCQLYIELK